MAEILMNPEHLKPLAAIFSPDPRSDNQAVLDILKPGATGIDEHHACVDRLKLANSVPESLIVQFETAKNLYLYAWFVYRFFPVAEHHALNVLELALRTRFPVLPKKYWDKSWKPTLRPLLKFAVNSGAVVNEGFRRWHDQVAFRARERYSNEKRFEMLERDLQRIELDYSNAVPNEQDQEWDYLPILLEVLPEIRNSYAHGSTLLHNQVLGTLELVCEIVNQLYEEKKEGQCGEMDAC